MNFRKITIFFEMKHEIAQNRLKFRKKHDETHNFLTVFTIQAIIIISLLYKYSKKERLEEAVW